jgi:ParB-like chromosome segregation protein Spo0J
VTARAAKNRVSPAQKKRGTVPYAEMRPLAAIKPYAQNPRKNAAAVVEKVASSIREFGFRQPIVVDGKGVVIAGHTRLLAAQSLGLHEAPVHVAEGLTAAQVRAYRLADNRTAQEAEWDDDLLAAELQALQSEDFDLPLTGFDESELELLMTQPVPDAVGDAANNPEKENCCPRCGYEW